MIRSKQPCQIVAESADAVPRVVSAVTVNESVLTSSEAVTVIIDDGISGIVDCRAMLSILKNKNRRLSEWNLSSWIFDRLPAPYHKDPYLPL